MRKVTLVLLPLLLFVITACGSQATQPAQPAAGTGASGAARTTPLNVVTTTGHLADAVKNVAGDNVTLVNLLGPGVDPHTHVATEGDINKFQEADVIFYNGLRLEAQMDRFLQQLGERGKTVVAVGDRLDTAGLLAWEPQAGLPYDPHIWNDVTLWKRVVEVVRDTLVQADAANAATYQANATAYLAQLDELNTYIKAEAQKIPAERRVLITAHDAFGYFARAYGFEVEAVQGISTETEASAADIQALVDAIVQRNVPAIFIESTISPRTIEAVQAGVKATGKDVQIGGSLYSDAMGEAGSGADTYIGMMRHNIDTVVKALAG